MKNKGRMQIFENKKVVFRPRDYQENVRRSRKCRVDKFSKYLDTKMKHLEKQMNQKVLKKASSPNKQ